MSSINYGSAYEIAQLIRGGKLSPVELMEETLEIISRKNPPLNAFVAIRAEEAMQEARAMADAIARGKDPGPLGGIPIGVKDLEDVQGMVTSFGSIPYKNNMANHDSIQVARLREAGAIVVGKTNTPEFGFTGFTKNRLYGITRNPWDLERTPGGSSGGSASAVASGMVSLSTGSDAGGSIRIPACYSGCFGFKPTYGRVPLGPFPSMPASQNSTLGPLSRTVTDAALYMDCVSGHHPADPDSLPSPPILYRECLNKLPKSLHIAFSLTLGYARVEKEIRGLVEEAVKAFDDMGYSVEIWEGDLPDVGNAWAEFMSCDIYAQIRGDFERIRSELGKTLVAALEHAATLSLDDFIRIQKTSTELKQKLAHLFTRFDLLLTPAMPTGPFAAKGPPPSEIEGHPIPLLGAVAFTYPFNVSGNPAATVRAGLTQAGLPAGLQIIGPRYRDDLVLQAAYAYEQARPWNNNWPDT